MDVKEASAILSVSERTIWRLVHDGDLPAVRIRGAVRFRASDVENIVAENRPDAYIAAHDEKPNEAA